jgi:hypothetical protein
MRWLGVSITGFLHGVDRYGSVLAVALSFGLGVAASLPRIFESIYKRRAAIIKEKGLAKASKIEAKAKKITAAAEADALKKRTGAQAALVRAGMEPGKSADAVALMRQLAIQADLPDGRRLDDDHLSKLLAPPKRSTDTKPDDGPENVIQIRP